MKFCLVVIVVLVCILSVSALADTTAFSSTNEALCGPICLLKICQRNKINTSLDDIINRTGAKNKASVSLATLAEAATSLGLKTKGVKISLEELIMLKLPAIAYIWSNHFVIIEGHDQKQVQIYDPNTDKTEVLTIDRFKNYYSGFSLFISSQPISITQAVVKNADIRLNNYVVDCGLHTEGETIAGTIEVRNAGDAVLKIKAITPSCSCIKTTLGSNEISPNGMEQLHFSLGTAGAANHVHELLYIATNDPITPVVECALNVTVSPVIIKVNPRSLNFGDLFCDDSSTDYVKIYDLGDGKLKIKNITSDNPYLVAHSGDLQVEGEQKYFSVAITLKPTMACGQLIATLAIETNNNKEPNKTISIVVRANVLGRIQLSSSMIHYGFIKVGETHQETVVLTSYDKKPFRILKAESESSDIVATLTSNADSTEYSMKATLKEDAPSGAIIRKITLFTDRIDQPRINIDVYAIVQ